jgi:hypothetical protein
MHQWIVTSEFSKSLSLLSYPRRDFPNYIFPSGLQGKSAFLITLMRAIYTKYETPGYAFFSPASCYFLLATNKLFISGISNTLVRHQSFNWKILYVFGFQTFQEERPHVLWLLWREGRFWCQPRPAVSIFGKWTTRQFDVAGSNVPNNFAMADTVRNNDTSLSHKSTSHVSTGEEEDLTEL